MTQNLILSNFKYSGDKIICKYFVEPTLVRGYLTIPDVSGIMNLDLYCEAPTLDELKPKVVEIIEELVSVPYELEYADITNVSYWRNVTL